VPDKGYGMRKCKVFGKKILPDFKERIKRIIMNWILINDYEEMREMKGWRLFYQNPIGLDLE
jgi:hypothetical protein